MQNENDRQRMQQTIALAAHVSDEATGLVKVLGLRLESAEERRDLEVHAERARNLYGLVCGMAGVHVAQDLREVQKQLTLTSLAVLTTAEFPLGGDYMAEAKLLGDADDGRALVVHVEVKSSSDRFRAVWFSSDYEETKAIVEYVDRKSVV